MRQLSCSQPPAVASHRALSPESGSSQLLQDPPLMMTPREVAVQQLLMHKLQGVADQQTPVSVQWAQPYSPANLQSDKSAGTTASNADTAGSTLQVKSGEDCMTY